MEGIALILIGTAIFSHSWYLLGLYADSRTVGVIMAALGLGLLVSLFTFQPQFLGSLGGNSVINLGEVLSLKTVMLVWGIYAGVVAAHCLWDMEERALGFFSVLLTVAGVVFLLFFLQLWINSSADVVLLLVTTSAMFTIIGGLLFFYMVFPFPSLRGVSAWAMLIQSILIVGIGLALVTTLIRA